MVFIVGMFPCFRVAGYHIDIFSFYNTQARGQYFTLDYTSTSDEPCPPSEFIVPGVEVPTEAPTAGSSVLTVFLPGVWGLLAWAVSTL